MKRVVTAGIAVLLALHLVGCNSSSSNKKVIVGDGLQENSVESQESGKQEGSQAQEIETLPAVTDREHQVLTLNGYEVTDITGSGKDAFSFSGSEISVNADTPDGEYIVTIHIRKIGSSETVSRKVKVIVSDGQGTNNSSTTSDGTNTTTDNSTTSEETNTTTDNTTTSEETNTTTDNTTSEENNNATIAFETATENASRDNGRWTWDEANSECSAKGMRLPTQTEILNHKDEVLAAMSTIDSDGDSSNGEKFESVVWTSSAATDSEDMKGVYFKPDGTTDTLELQKSSTYYFTCVK